MYAEAETTAQRFVFRIILLMFHNRPEEMFLHSLMVLLATKWVMALTIGCDVPGSLFDSGVNIVESYQI